MRKSVMSCETTGRDASSPEKTDEKLDKTEDNCCIEEALFPSSSSNGDKDEIVSVLFNNIHTRQKIFIFVIRNSSTIIVPW
jgi:hypothetical protein